MTELPIGPLAVAVLVTAVLSAPLAAAHASHLDVDPQGTSEQKVRVEGVFSSADGWLVVHELNATGDPEAAIGHVPLQPDAGFRTEVPGPIDEAAWANLSTPTRLAVAMHEEEGDPGFDPDEDPILEAVGGPVIERFTLARTDAAVYVGALEFGPQPVDNGTVTVRAVALAEPGHVVLRSEDGQPVGDAELDAGEHRNVTVQLTPDANVSGRTTLQVQLYHADDGGFEGDEEPVRVGSAPVATDMSVERSQPTEANDTGSSGENATDGNASAGRQATPTPTAAALVAGVAAVAIAAARRPT